ncbi:DUF3221 domain-containing protein [Aquisalibacillus elongatus]|uniref:Uncharacterized protein DUF3221 n=1 Tax=Aquisalibacillus elongatus TaxID=485577 RepID=A0A3N5CE88_9BACI|nr:DUF3221 domain-containing protein [Aquisalibacillus elongatus]RPF55491.1 uncharacterized protein DUF3221 [Aquisalibacillus elongatus]
MNNNVKQEVRFFMIFIPLLLMITLPLWFIFGPSTSIKENMFKQEGIIVMKKFRQIDEERQLLVIPNIDQDDMKDKTKIELEVMAQEKEGAYYHVSEEKFNELNVGSQIIVYWEYPELHSDPPQRGAEIIEVVSK